MAKELLIMRHAKSSWKNESVADRDRPLNERGRRDTPQMATLLEARNLSPDVILSSSANRAMSTALLIQKHFPKVELEAIEDFYLAPAEMYVEVLQRLDHQFSRPLVVGHNPGLELLISLLCGENEIMPTAAIAHVHFTIDDWGQLTTKLGRLDSVFRPKECFA